MAKRILVIDNEEMIVMILQELLTSEGYEVEVAYNGVDGIEVLEQSLVFDMVIVDYKMPGANGNKVIEAMRSMEMYAKTPIILISGSVKSEVDFPAEELYQKMIEKPFDLNDVLISVKELLY